MADLKALVGRVERYLKQMEHKYQIHHLGGPQGFTTMYLYRHPEQEVFIKDIERELRISKSVASNLIHRMEKNGFISIIPSKKDKRYKQIVLTEDGMNKANMVASFFSEIRNQLLYGIAEEDLRVVQRVMDQISVNLEERIDNSVPSKNKIEHEKRR